MSERANKQKQIQRSSTASKEFTSKQSTELHVKELPKPGDVELYRFSLPEDCKEPIFCSLRYPNPKFVFTEHKATIKEIVNEEVMGRLESVKSEDVQRRRSVDEIRASNQLKVLKQSLSRITRYSNKRKFDERIGFASTLAAKAEEIGIPNTINFLLKAITSYLVPFAETIGYRH